MKNIRRFIAIFFAITLGIFSLYVGGAYLKRDSEGPVITCDKDRITASFEDTDKTLLKGVKAADARDGDVSDSLLIESIEIMEGKECMVNYAAFDKSNNVSKASRIVEFEDYRPIHFSFSGPLRFVLGSDAEILKSIHADDCMDGDITNRIKLVSRQEDSGYNGAGIYDYELQVTNSIGDTAVLPVSVEFYADSYEERLFHPNIYLKKYVVYLERGSVFQPMDYLDSVGIGSELYLFDENIGSGLSMTPAEQTGQETDGNGRKISGVISYESVKYQSNVKTSEPGNYTVEYSCTTKDNYIGATQMVVVVE